MKRTYLSRRNALLSGARLSWGSAALALALLALVLRIALPGVFTTILTPAFTLSNALANKSHNFFSSFSDAAALSTQNEQLVNQNHTLSSENQALTAKIVDLTELLGGARTPVRSVVAGVLARPPASPYDTLVVGAGSDEGVAIGMKAFGAGDVPLGIVTTVTASSARVTLFSAPGTLTAGWIGNTKVPLTLTGSGAGTFSASVSRAAPITVGDIVYLPGPGALPAGSLVRIDSDLSSPSIELRIQPTLNLFETTWVELRDTSTSL